MAKIDDIQARMTAMSDGLTALGDSLGNIADDIERIKQNVSGGLTEAEATQVVSDLDGLSARVTAAADQAKGIADATPEPENPV